VTPLPSQPVGAPDHRDAPGLPRPAVNLFAEVDALPRSSAITLAAYLLRTRLISVKELSHATGCTISAVYQWMRCVRPYPTPKDHP
jgi:hypothetical protein